MNSPEEDQEQRLERMAAGREANALLGILRPYIDDRLSILVQKLAAEYRNRTAEYPVLLGTAAQIAGLLDLLSERLVTLLGSGEGGGVGLERPPTPSTRAFGRRSFAASPAYLKMRSRVNSASFVYASSTGIFARAGRLLLRTSSTKSLS